MHRIFSILLVCSFYGVSNCACAQGIAASDPQAVTFATRSLAALTGGTLIGDVTLTGNETWNGRETGSATLKALGSGESETEFALTTGTRTVIRDAQSGIPLGKWTGPNDISGAVVNHNCLTDAAWFFPALGSLQGGSNVVLSYIGEESRNGAMVQHIQSYVPQSSQSPSPTSQSLSTMDFYLDGVTLLPVAVTFNAHPDTNASANLPVEIDYSDYQMTNGYRVPMHIQRYQQSSLIMDIHLSSASFNVGLSLSAFAIN